MDKRTAMRMALIAEGAINEALKEEGCSAEAGRIKAEAGKAFVSFTIKQDDCEEAEREEFEKLAKHYGIPASAYGSEVTINGKLIRITGLKKSRPKMPVSGEEVATGRGIKMPVQLLKRHLK